MAATLDSALGIVGRARIATRGGSGFVARQRVERAFEAIDPARIVRRQILIVRRLKGRLADRSDARAFVSETNDALIAVREHASRPGPGARGAPAVLFESKEELLLHLALDLAAGEITGCWYWEHLRAMLPIQTFRSVATLLAIHARDLPAVARLAERLGLLESLACACDETEAIAVLQALSEAASLGDIAAPLRTTDSAPTPWLPVAPRLSPTVSPEATRLVAQTLHGVGLQLDSEEPDLSALIGHEAARALASTSASARALFTVALLLDAAPGSRARAMLGVRVAMRPARPTRSALASAAQASAEGRAELGVSRSEPVARRSRSGQGDAGPAQTPEHTVSIVLGSPGVPAASALEKPRLPLGEEGLPSLRAEGARVGLAGVFFIIPLMGEAGQRAAAESELGGWPVFCDVAWKLATCAHRGEVDWQTDPLWQVLRAMTGDARVDTGSLAFQCARRLGRRWIERERIRPVLRRVLARAGVVHVTRTHIDVVLSLDQADLEIRRAGLDLDPGWVSWLGRVVSFIYE